MIWALIFTLLGNGEPEIFYIDEFDKGVKEYVLDKERRGEILDSLKSGTKRVKSFYKAREGQVKELKKKNLDQNTTEQWFKDFFVERDYRGHIYYLCRKYSWQLSCKST